MDTNHTPEPWATSEGYHGTIFSLHPEWRQPWCISIRDTGRHCSKELNQANARRIVACVNACKGIETEFLEEVGEHWAQSQITEWEYARGVDKELEMMTLKYETLRALFGNSCPSDASLELVINHARGRNHNDQNS